MSSISFVSPSGEVLISGRERLMMGAICQDFRRMQTGEFKYDDLGWLPHVVSKDHYLYDMWRRMQSARSQTDRADLKWRLAQAVGTVLSNSSDPAFMLDGEPVDLFGMALNSAIVWGNRPVKLAAKLHGQCEIHAYIEGEDRAWLADLVQEALDVDLFNEDAWGYDGWPKLIEFLRSSSDEPVVTSYSVTDSFPNTETVPEDVDMGDPDEYGDYDAWYDAGDAKQWEWGMAYLRATPGLRISPDTLDVLFDDGLTGKAFLARLMEIEKNPPEALPYPV